MVRRAAGEVIEAFAASEYLESMAAIIRTDPAVASAAVASCRERSTSSVASATSASSTATVAPSAEGVSVASNSLARRRRWI